MNKKWIWILGIVACMGLATAGLVSYLSGTRATSITVESPLELDVTSPVNVTAHGGETVVVSYEVNNLANVTINGNFQAIIDNVDGVGCSDFVSIKANGIDMSCTMNNATQIVVRASQSYAPLDKTTVDIAYTYAANALGTYIALSQVMA